MTDAQTLVDSHTRAELDQIATEAGVEDPEAMANKEAVAAAIVEAEGGDTPAEPQEAPAGDESEDPYPSPSLQGEELDEAQGALPEGWTIVNAGPDYFSAEKTVESLGLQKVSEGGETLEALVAACEAYDAHLDRVAEGEIPTTSGATAP